MFKKQPAYFEGTESLREQTTNTEESAVPAKNQGSWIERIVSQHFTILLTVLALIGGATAMLLPLGSTDFWLG